MKKIEIGRWTYGYYRVMEYLAWTYCARAVGLFNDLPALLMIVGTLILFESFRLFVEQRDANLAVTEEFKQLTKEKK